MPGDIRHHAILKSASERLEELIDACWRRGAIHGHFPNLAADVTRKAKSLRTSLASLSAFLDGAAEPEQPQESCDFLQDSCGRSCAGPDDLTLRRAASLVHSCR